MPPRQSVVLVVSALCGVLELLQLNGPAVSASIFIFRHFGDCSTRKKKKTKLKGERERVNRVIPAAVFSRTVKTESEVRVEMRERERMRVTAAETNTEFRRSQQ